MDTVARCGDCECLPIGAVHSTQTRPAVSDVGTCRAHFCEDARRVDHWPASERDYVETNRYAGADAAAARGRRWLSQIIRQLSIRIDFALHGSERLSSAALYFARAGRMRSRGALVFESP